MKKLIAYVCASAFILLMAFHGAGQHGTPTAYAQFTVTNLHTVATNLVSTNLKAMKVTFIGLKAGGVSNAAPIYVGPSTNAQYYVIHPGERHIIETQPNTHIRIGDWWLRTPTTGDGITIIYQ